LYSPTGVMSIPSDDNVTASHYCRPSDIKSEGSYKHLSDNQAQELYQVVFDGVVCGCCARRDVYLAIDGVEVGAHGVRTEK